MSDNTRTAKVVVSILTSKNQTIEAYETRKYAQFLYSVKEAVLYFRQFLYKPLRKSHSYFWTRYVLSQ